MQGEQCKACLIFKAGSSGCCTLALIHEDVDGCHGFCKLCLCPLILWSTC